jgi:hypothetical protein
MTRRLRSRLEPADWYSIRPVRSLKPATYRCPLCGYQLHAMSDHVLIAPEGDTSRRRHAHLECVAAANLPGRPARRGLLARLFDQGVPYILKRRCPYGSARAAPSGKMG